MAKLNQLLKADNNKGIDPILFNKETGYCIQCFKLEADKEELFNPSTTRYTLGTFILDIGDIVTILYKVIKK